MATTRATRIAVVLSAAALVTSVGLAGGPAIAKALNADTVDHKHAVSSTAGVKARKGKLVATSKRTGLLPNNIIRTAPNAAKLGRQPASAYLKKADVNQVLALGGTPTLPPSQVSTSSTTFTTTRAGRLLIDFTGSGQLGCASVNFVRWWLQVDGTPIVNSSLQLGKAAGSIGFDYNGFPNIHLTGVTDAPVAAGEHTLVLLGGCTSGSSAGSGSSSLPGVGSVTVLSNGVASTPSARHAAAPGARRACVTTGAGRTCR
jgi:hypothetical protein